MTTDDVFTYTPKGNVESSYYERESFLDKFPTIGRKHKKKNLLEVVKLDEEGRQAMKTPLSPVIKGNEPESYQLMEGQTYSTVSEQSKQSEKFQQLIATLMEWVNGVLNEQRIIVRNLEEDFYDGQIFQKLIEKLTHRHFDHPEIMQSEMSQKQRLRSVLGVIQNELGVKPMDANRRWPLEKIHAKELIPITNLLIDLITRYSPNTRLPEDVKLKIHRVTKTEGILIPDKNIFVQLTGSIDATIRREHRKQKDGFDILIETAPDELPKVERILADFVNKHLAVLNFVVDDISTQFADGVQLIMLIAALENYFVPFYHFYESNQTFPQKVSNVELAFSLMESAGMDRPQNSPEDIVNGDLRAILRTLFIIFTKHTRKE